MDNRDTRTVLSDIKRKLIANRVNTQKIFAQAAEVLEHYIKPMSQCEKLRLVALKEKVDAGVITNSEYKIYINLRERERRNDLIDALKNYTVK